MERDRVSYYTAGALRSHPPLNPASPVARVSHELAPFGLSFFKVELLVITRTQQRRVHVRRHGTKPLFPSMELFCSKELKRMLKTLKILLRKLWPAGCWNHAVKLRAGFHVSQCLKHHWSPRLLQQTLTSQVSCASPKVRLARTMNLAPRAAAHGFKRCSLLGQSRICHALRQTRVG